MPTYDFQCPACNHKAEDVVRPLADYGTPLPCPECAAPMNQLVSAPMLVMDYAGYRCPITDDWIEGKRAHRENLKKHSCRVYEPGEKEEMLKRRAAEEKALDESLDQTVGATIEAMAPRQQEVLHQELVAGAGTAVERR